MSRRSIIILVVALAVLGPLVLGGIAVVAGGGDDLRRLGAADKRSYASGHFALYTDTQGSEQHLGFLKSFSGCGIRANVAGVGPGDDNVIRKHVSNIAYEPCIVRFGITGMDPAIYGWINDSLSHKANRRGFWIVSSDFDFKAKTGIHIVDAAIEKVVFPQFDGASKDAAYIALTLRPDSIAEFEQCCGTFTPGNVKGAVSKQQKLWLASNFRLVLGNTADTLKISEISSWEFRNEEPASVGEEKVVQRGVPELNLGDLQVTMAKSTSASWRKWFDDFVIKGNNGKDYETTARIEFLAPNMKDVIGTLTFSGVGVVAHEGSGQEANKDTIARETYTLYVEEASFAVVGEKPAAPPPPPPPPPPPTSTTTTGTTTAEPPPPPPPPPPTETTPEKLVAGPEDLKASAVGEGEVELVWSAVEGAEYYVILASSERGGEFNELATAREPAITVADLRPGVYTFVVRAVVREAETADSPEAVVEVG